MRAKQLCVDCHAQLPLCLLYLVVLISGRFVNQLKFWSAFFHDFTAQRALKYFIWSYSSNHWHKCRSNPSINLIKITIKE
jgi:hypothetical protein